MPPRSNQYSYIRATRDVAPSGQLSKFYERVAAVSNRVIPFYERTEVRTEPGMYRPVGRTALYLPEDYRYTHFEQRALPGDPRARKFPQVAARMLADTWPAPGKLNREPEAKEVPNPLPIVLSASLAAFGIEPKNNEGEGLVTRAVNLVRIQPSAPPDRVDEETDDNGIRTVQPVPKLGSPAFEYALVFDEDDPVTQALSVMNRAIYDTINSFGAGNEILDPYKPLVVGVPFARLPRDSTEDLLEEWEEKVFENIPDQGIKIALDGLNWTQQVRT
ncbi:MAG: hypothetical protein JWM81_385 [Candidatus Saccharibacteria bacterium]|nr:hypothetical protein [Candidatus Saccharibacteria bacterium]